MSRIYGAARSHGSGRIKSRSGMTMTRAPQQPRAPYLRGQGTPTSAPNLSTNAAAAAAATTTTADTGVQSNQVELPQPTLPPADKKLCARIDDLAKYICEDEQAEGIVNRTEADNVDYVFLRRAGVVNDYYRWSVYAHFLQLTPEDMDRQAEARFRQRYAVSNARLLQGTQYDVCVQLVERATTKRDSIKRVCAFIIRQLDCADHILHILASMLEMLTSSPTDLQRKVALLYVLDAALLHSQHERTRASDLDMFAQAVSSRIQTLVCLISDGMSAAQKAIVERVLGGWKTNGIFEGAVVDSSLASIGKAIAKPHAAMPYDRASLKPIHMQSRRDSNVTPMKERKQVAGANSVVGQPELWVSNVLHLSAAYVAHRARTDGAIYTAFAQEELPDRTPPPSGHFSREMDRSMDKLIDAYDELYPSSRQHRPRLRSRSRSRSRSRERSRPRPRSDSYGRSRSGQNSRY
jgi:CID domain